MAGFFDTDSRLNRGRFLLQFFAFAIPAAFLVGLSNAAGGDLWPFDLIAGAIMLFTVFPVIKRFHDLGHSGWWAITTFIPLLALIPYIYLFFWRGTEGTNQYGPDPLAPAVTPVAQYQPQHSLRQTQVSSNQTASMSTQSASRTPDPAYTPAQSSGSTPAANQFEIDEEAIYEQVANEVESGNVRKGLWTKLWAELDGDDAKVKLAYVKARAKEIIINAQQALDKKIQERDREIALGNEYVTIIQKIKASTATREDKERLIEILGGTLSRAEPNSATNSQCKVSLAGKEHEFHTELEFVQWIESRLLPQIDNIESPLQNAPNPHRQRDTVAIQSPESRRN